MTASMAGWSASGLFVGIAGYTSVFAAQYLGDPELAWRICDANNVLQIQDGAIVDVGGGTTGIAIFKDGNVVYTADEPTGGTHFSLVIAGATGTTFEEAEEMKKNPREQTRLYPIIRPVMEKVGAIINRHIDGHHVDRLYLVGGTCAYPGMDKVIEEYTGVETVLPGNPLFVTPLGIAMNN